MQANCVFFSFAFDENVRDRNALKPTTHYSSGEMIIHFTSSFYFESGASKANRFAVPQLHCNCIGLAWPGLAQPCGYAMFFKLFTLCSKAVKV